MALDAVLPLLYRARAGALVLSMANPRHAHEHRTLARVPLPSSWLLVAGVIDTTTNYVEHPEVVAERIELAVRAMGDVHRVIAGTDCGFATAAGLGEVAEEVVWRKLHALRAGAEIASKAAVRSDSCDMIERPRGFTAVIGQQHFQPGATIQSARSEAVDR